MKAKVASSLFGLLLLGNAGSAVAEDYADLCGSDIDGVTLAMSKTEVQSTWASNGYEKTADSDDSKKNPNRPELLQSLQFQTADRQPNEDFINSVGWQRTLSTGHNKIYANYVAPTDPARLEAYEAFYRSKLTDYCEHEIDALRATAPAVRASRGSRMNPNPMSPTQEFCENALKGEFRTNDIGHAQTPHNSLHITDERGCRVTYGNLNLRGFTSGFKIGIEHTR